MTNIIKDDFAAYNAAGPAMPTVPQKGYAAYVVIEKDGERIAQRELVLVPNNQWLQFSVYLKQSLDEHTVLLDIPPVAVIVTDKT